MKLLINMKEKILLLSFSFLSAWNIGLHADNIISVNEVSIRPGSTAELIVSLENDADFKVYAYDFRLYLPDGIEVDTKANGSYNFTLKERNADHSTNVQMTSDGAIQFGVNSPTLYLTGNSGPVLGIILKASAGLAEGTYQASIERITYANKEAQTVHPVNITFDIEVRNLVVLDENSTIMPEATNGTVDVNVLRTIRGGNWQTIVLPFANAHTYLDVWKQGLQLLCKAFQIDFTLPSLLLAILHFLVILLVQYASDKCKELRISHVEQANKFFIISIVVFQLQCKVVGVPSYNDLIQGLILWAYVLCVVIMPLIPMAVHHCIFIKYAKALVKSIDKLHCHVTKLGKKVLLGFFKPYLVSHTTWRNTFTSKDVKYIIIGVISIHQFTFFEGKCYCLSSLFCLWVIAFNQL